MSDLVLSVIVLCYNKWNFTKSCLDDLSKLPLDHEIIVFDNGSSDDTQKELEKWNKHPNFKYIRSNINYGFAGGNNRAFQEASAPNVLFLNNDIRVKDNFNGWTQEIIKHCELGLVGPTMGQLDQQFNFIKEANVKLTGKNTYMSGWCLASSKKILDKLKQKDYIGPFSEEFGLAYFEDTDVGFLAKTLDIPFEVVKLPVVHFGKITSQQLNTRELYLKAKKIFIGKWSKK